MNNKNEFMGVSVGSERAEPIPYLSNQSNNNNNNNNKKSLFSSKVLLYGILCPSTELIQKPNLVSGKIF